MTHNAHYVLARFCTSVTIAMTVIIEAYLPPRLAAELWNQIPSDVFGRLIPPLGWKLDVLDLFLLLMYTERKYV